MTQMGDGPAFRECAQSGSRALHEHDHPLAQTKSPARGRALGGIELNSVHFASRQAETVTKGRQCNQRDGAEHNDATEDGFYVLHFYPLSLSGFLIS